MLHELDTPILHLDIKPGNILVSRGMGMVADFGLAMLADKLALRGARFESNRRTLPDLLLKPETPPLGMVDLPRQAQNYHMRTHSLCIDHESMIAARAKQPH